MRTAAVVVALLVLLSGCSDDDGGDGAGSASTSVSTEATTTTTTTAPPAASESTDSAPTTDPSAPSESEPEALPDAAGEEWASELIRAWGAGDRQRASELASPNAVDRLFLHADPGGQDWELDGCEGAAGTTYCTFTRSVQGDTVTTGQASMPDEATGEPVPIGIIDFGEPGQDDLADQQALIGAYGSELVRAWGAGDRDEALGLAPAAVVDELFAIADPGGPDWELEGCDVGGDVPACYFREPGRTETLTILFDPGALPLEPAVTGVELV